MNGRVGDTHNDVIPFRIAFLHRAAGADRQDAVPHIGNERRHDEQDERDYR